MATFTVTTAADVVNAGDGRLSLREAVAQANATTAADAIVFASGLEGSTLVLTGGDLVIDQDVRIDGDANDDGLEVTLDGNRQWDSETGYTGHRVLTVAGGGADANLADLTLANGYVDGGSDVALVVRDSQLADNYGWDRGGAISLTGGSSLVMEGSTVARNAGDQLYQAYGGGLFIRDSTATIARSTIHGNAASEGGGIYMGDSRVTVTDSTVAGNEAIDRDGYGSGGGVTVASGVLVVRNSTITGNIAGEEDGQSARGGGILAQGALDIANSIVAGNVEGTTASPALTSPAASR